MVLSGRCRSLVLFYPPAGGDGGVGGRGHTGGNPGARPLPPAGAGARPGVLCDEGGHATAKPAEHGQGGCGEYSTRLKLK